MSTPSPVFPLAGTSQEIHYPVRMTTSPQSMRSGAVRRRPESDEEELGQVIVGPWTRATSNSKVIRADADPSLRDDDYDREYVSRLWSEDWDCPEDAAYDEL